MSATLNAFPPLHTFTFRHWTLVLIALIHLGILWAINSGMSQDIIRLVIPDMTVVPYKEVERPAPAERRPAIDPRIEPINRNFIPNPELDPITIVEDPILDGLEPSERIISVTPAEPPRRVLVEEPQIDPRIGLSEPTYPATEIRLGHEGTVLLSVYVLENGRVGEVRVDRSSGYERLDNAASREAKRWRLKPGTRDGQPAAMWKQIPITYQLKNVDGSTLRF